MGVFLNQAGSAAYANSCLANKLFFIEDLASYVLDQKIPGSVAEAGVYKGGCARLLATIFQDKEILLFDSFEGMKENDSDPTGLHKVGDFSDTSLESVQEFLRDKPNCKFFPGWFPDTASSLKDETFAFVHADMDYYQSTVSCIEVFWPRLNPGGIMVFDDYEWVACPGVKKALDEYFGDMKSGYKVVAPDDPGLLTIAYVKE